MALTRRLGLLVLACLGPASRAAPPEIPASPVPPEAPAPAPAPSSPDGPWSLELIVAGEPEQRLESPCGVGSDCMSPAKAYFGGAVRAAYRRPERWSVAATLGLATLVDQEERPPSYDALTLRADVQVELGRGEDLGVAVRVSPVLVFAWALTGSALASDIPAFALLIGTSRLWGEVGLPTLPTPSDPRLFYGAFGFALGRWSGTTGIGTFGTLGYADDETDRAGSRFGVYGDVTVKVSDRFDLRLMAILSSPVQASLGFAWRFAAD